MLTDGIRGGPGRRPLERLLGMLAPERRDIASIVVFSVVVGLLTLAVAFLLYRSRVWRRRLGGWMAVALYLGRPGPAAGGGLPGSGFVGKTRSGKFQRFYINSKHQVLSLTRSYGV